jgi:hypothetical protein
MWDRLAFRGTRCHPGDDAYCTLLITLVSTRQPLYLLRTWTTHPEDSLLPSSRRTCGPRREGWQWQTCWTSRSSSSSARWWSCCYTVGASCRPLVLTAHASCTGVYAVLFAGTVWVLRARRQGPDARTVSPIIDVCSWFIFITLTIVSPWRSRLRGSLLTLYTSTVRVPSTSPTMGSSSSTRTRSGRSCSSPTQAPRPTFFVKLCMGSPRWVRRCCSYVLRWLRWPLLFDASARFTVSGLSGAARGRSSLFPPHSFCSTS